MPNYRYVAKDAVGNRKEGFRTSAGTGEVFEWLREQGLTPIAISEAAAAGKSADGNAQHGKVQGKVQSEPADEDEKPKSIWQMELGGGKVKSADLSSFCWQLTTMLEGGVPIATATEILGADVESKNLKRVLKKVLADMRAGIAFSESLCKFPKIFNKIAVAIILAGETGGDLPLALQRLAEYFDNRDKLAKKIKAAMAYPCFVVFFIILVVIFIMAFIIPRFRMLFEQLGDKKLPAFTLGFMAVYDFLCGNIHYIIGVIAVTVFVLTTLYRKSPAAHYTMGSIFLRMPLLGSIASQGFVAMFCRTMSTLVTSGVPILEVFDILSEMSQNDIIRNAVTSSRNRVVGGSSIAKAMTESGFFPNMVLKMVQVGEESGSLPKVLERTAMFYERKVDTLITIVMGLMEPIMIVVVGGVVLVVVLALYLPIFSMS